MLHGRGKGRTPAVTDLGDKWTEMLHGQRRRADTSSDTLKKKLRTPNSKVFGENSISWYALSSPQEQTVSSVFINDFLSALTSLFVWPHSSPVSRTTETSHRVQGRCQDKDKRRKTRTQSRATEPSHRVQGARPRQGQDEDKAQPQSPATRPTQSPATEFRGAAKRRTRPGHRAQPQRTRGATEPSHRVQGRGQ